ncbi:hypothetical protein LOD99_14473 [Oopsacas minuta]|uniref:Uncharacterized protein n=1 Tax=Oopsacas minuta TaxID=111878 RepID=A0AAV7KF80_9METZ|nr:hypothetical protein LOD99_14450 [Oopsacas minuta]KAI6659550.1 hypothetical protein LOD99_14473 [Oopsacas minuta]
MIALELWRAKIGLFNSKRIMFFFSQHFQLEIASGIALLACVISMLLVIGCVELNPGPKGDGNKNDDSLFVNTVPKNFDFVQPSSSIAQFTATDSNFAYIPPN